MTETNTANQYRTLLVDHGPQGGAVETRDGRIERTATAQAAQHQASTASRTDDSGRITHAISREKHRPIPISEARETDLIDRGGMQVSIATLLSRGVLQRDDNGTLRWAKDGGKAVQEQRQAQERASQEQPKAEALSPQVEAVVTEVAQNANPHDVLGVINTLASGQEPTADQLGRIASTLHQTPEQVGETFGAIREAMERQAIQAFDKFGPEAADIIAWGYRHRPQDMARAIRTHATTRSTAAYNAIAEAYVAELDRHAPDAILSAALTPGWSAKRAADGKVLLIDPQGRQHTYRSLVKAGVAKVSRRR